MVTAKPTSAGPSWKSLAISLRTGESSSASEPTAQTPAVRPQVVDQGRVAGVAPSARGAAAWEDMADLGIMFFDHLNTRCPFCQILYRPKNSKLIPFVRNHPQCP